MRKYLLAAAAATAIATPAAARDNSPYVGINGGFMVVENMDVDFDFDDGTSASDFLSINHDYGYDIDAVAGYDFGMVRAEAEVAYKRASHDDYLGDFAGGAADDADGKSRALSLMGNLLLDFGDDTGLSGYVGGGAGFAKVRVRYDDGFLTDTLSDSGFAWQAIAGVRMPISDNIDIGLKYRLFNTKVSDSIVGDSDLDLVGGDVKTRFRSHSLLASLIFNFAAPPPPPPPPPPPAPPAPPPPATQTCPDGSVILATDSCPLPPPPPPPPPPAPERG